MLIDWLLDSSIPKSSRNMYVLASKDPTRDVQAFSPSTAVLAYLTCHMTATPGPTLNF